MKIRSFILFGGLLATSVCCQSMECKSKETGKEEHQFVLKESKTRMQDSLLFKSVTIIPLEMDTKKYAAKIDRIYFDRNTFFLLEKNFQCVSLYDKEGHAKKTIMGIENSSQEYRKLADICIDKVRQELLVLASEPSKIMYYSYQGEFLREKALPTYFESIVTDGEFIYLQDYNVMKGEKEIMIYDMNLEKKQEALEVSRQFKGHEIFSNFSFTKGNMMTQDTIIHITRCFDNKIYCAENGKVSLEYTLDFEDNALPDILLEQKMRPSEFMRICREHNYISFITDVIENDKLMLFNTNVGFCVCNKPTGDITKYNYIIDSITGYDIENKMQIVGNTNNRLAMYWPLTFVKDSKIQPVKESSFYKRISAQSSKLLPKIDNRHNAILVIYEF